MFLQLHRDPADAPDDPAASPRFQRSPPPSAGTTSDTLSSDRSTAANSANRLPRGAEGSFEGLPRESDRGEFPWTGSGMIRHPVLPPGRGLEPSAT
jgi:hypothetical protein